MSIIAFITTLEDVRKIKTKIDTIHSTLAANLGLVSIPRTHSYYIRPYTICYLRKRKKIDGCYAFKKKKRVSYRLAAILRPDIFSNKLCIIVQNGINDGELQDFSYESDLHNSWQMKEFDTLKYTKETGNWAELENMLDMMLKTYGNQKLF